MVAGERGRRRGCVGNNSVWKRTSPPIETAAVSTLVDEAMFKESGKQVKPTQGNACAADSREIQVSSIGVHDFRMWGVLLHAEVPVMSTPTDKILIERTF